MKSRFFGYKNKISFGLVLIIVMLFCLTATVTLALFFTSDWASSKVTMSGKVHIEAVGNGEPYESIEDTDTSNLKVTIGDGYNKLIPGGSININANCKVYKSTTKPHLRADINMFLYDKETGEAIGSEYSDEHAFMPELYSSIYYQLTGNNWYLHTDGYFYYIGDIAQTGTGGDTKLAEVDATLDDTVVPFITSPVKFPTSVTEDYSGYKVSFKIKFQAIQNYIPDDNGARVTSTITNSLKIFNHFNVNAPTEYTDHAHFNITKNSDGAWEINPKSKNLPENVVLPSVTPDGDTITTIGNGFTSSLGIKNLVVPSSYTKIAQGAFQNCTSLESVDMSMSKIEVISQSAFNSCSKLESVLLPETLKVIGAHSFLSTMISNIQLPDSLENINEGSFKWTQLRSIFIPKNVNKVDPGCIVSSYLSSIIVDEENPYFNDVNNEFLISEDGKRCILAISLNDQPVLNVPEGVTTLTFFSMYMLEGGVYLSSTVSTIESSVFGSGINSIIVHEDNVNFFSDGCALFNAVKTNIYLIYKRDMSGQTYNLPNELIAIQGATVFDGVTIGTLNIGSNLNVSSNVINAYMDNIYVADDNPYIYDDNGVAVLTKDGKTFIRYATNNSANTYTMPNTVEKICENAFRYGRNLITINLSNNTKEIQYSSFAHCAKLENIQLPSSVQKCGDYIFRFCYLIRDITLRGELGNFICASASSLKSLTFDTSCDKIGYNIIRDCGVLETIEFKLQSLPELEGDPFGGCTSNFKIYVPDTALDTYKSATYFKNYADRIYPVSQKPST